MNEEAKREFDSLHSLSEQAWRDWDHKSKHEWRLSFGLWAALLAASAAVLQTDFRPKPPQSEIVLGGLLFLIVLHVWFLAWIQGRMWDYRTEFLQLCARMPDPVRPPKPPDRTRCWCKSLSLWTQAVITLLLAAVLGLIVLSEPSSKKPTPTKGQGLSGLTLAAADGPQGQRHIE